MINTKLQSIIDTKSAIGNAIVNKGGTITGETPFFNYAAQIDGISTGTPQTIFQASDGSKWARTNAVNLTNVSNNVTSDFNYWQPANNSTSNPILNIGTVGANISGNIRLVPVNQVNIAQYVNIVINDTTGAKYVGYNGYDSQTNPTPTGNVVFNRWVLNNSASGTIIFANTTVTNGGTFNGPNFSVNQAVIPFVQNISGNFDTIYDITTNNGFIFTGGSGGRITRYHESNGVITHTANVSVATAIAVRNNFIYVADSSGFANTIVRFHESNLASVSPSNTPLITGFLTDILVAGNNIITATARGTSSTVLKHNASNMGFIMNTSQYGTNAYSVIFDSGFIYVGGGEGTSFLFKHFESNFSDSASINPGFARVQALAHNGSFLYAAGWGAGFFASTVRKYWKSNLAFVGETASYGNGVYTISVNNGFIYVGGRGANAPIRKYYESNLTLIGSSNGTFSNINSSTINNGSIYVVGVDSGNIRKFSESGISTESIPFYNITKIKE